jgi:hypothetical protein
MRKHKNKRIYLYCTARGDRSKITKQEHQSVQADPSGRKNRIRPNPQVCCKLQTENDLIAAFVREQETDDASTKPFHRTIKREQTIVMRERKIVPRENLTPRTHDLGGGLKTRSERRNQVQNLQILGSLEQRIHKKQIKQPETVARAERDREIHEDQNEQHGESRNQSSHYREQEAKPNPTSNRKSKRKIELPHTPASTEHESRKRVGLQIWRRW